MPAHAKNKPHAAAKKKAKSRYFVENPASALPAVMAASGKRPNGQNSEKVKKKVFKRLELNKKNLRKVHLAALKAAAKGTPFSKANIDMAHTISASEIATIQAAAITKFRGTSDPKKKQAIKKKTKKYARSMISTNASDASDVSHTVSEVFNDPLFKSEGGRHADALFARMSRSSGNLIPGDGPANRGIGERRDQHTMQNGNPFSFTQARVDASDGMAAFLGVPQSHATRFAPKTGSGGVPLTSSDP